jgi:hypothetical protein
MSENPPAYPPPPPAGATPPSGQPATPPPPPVYQGPAAPDYVQPYLQQQQPYASQSPYQQPFPTAGAAGLMSQFTGRAAWSIGIGVVTIVAPFVVHWVFYLLALVGLIYGVQAIRRGQLIGGIIGIVLNIIGGLLTILLLTSG